MPAISYKALESLLNAGETQRVNTKVLALMEITLCLRTTESEQLSRLYISTGGEAVRPLRGKNEAG